MAHIPSYNPDLETSFDCVCVCGMCEAQSHGAGQSELLIFW